MKNLNLFLLIFIIFFYSCKEKNHCLTNYSGNSTKLGLIIDSIDVNSDGCSYYTTIPICSGEDNIDFKGKMFVKDSIFYFKIIEEPRTKYFPLFNLTKRDNYVVNINKLDTTKIQIQEKLFVRLNQILNTKNNKEIFVFRVSGLFCYLGSEYDGVYFINYEEGVIGSYLYFIDEKGNEYIGYPGGNIFKDKIDYSKFIEFKLL